MSETDDPLGPPVQQIPHVVQLACPHCGKAVSVTVNLLSPFMLCQCKEYGCRKMFSVSLAFDVQKWPRKNKGYVAPESFKMKLTE